MNSPKEPGQADPVGRLIRQVGAREAVPPERMARSHDKVKAHWLALQEARATGRGQERFSWMSLAAGLMVATGVVLIVMNLRIGQAPLAPASVERVIGEAQLAGVSLSDTHVVTAGSVIETGNGRLALRMTGGQSLRLDRDSRLAIEAADRVRLDRGAVYIDSDIAAQDASILVQTPFGNAQDIGTRFQVRVRESELVVGVRDGLVEVSEHGAQAQSVNAGYFLAMVAGQSGDVQPQSEDGPDWAWVEQVAPVFRLEDATLEEYLQWYAHERGLELVWANDRSRVNAQQIRLSGSIDDISIEQSLEVVRQVAPFRHETDLERITVTVE